MTYLKDCDIGSKEKTKIRNDVDSKSCNPDPESSIPLLQENKYKVHALETAAIKPEPFNQYVSAGVVSGVATVSIGTVLGFSAILLPQLKEEMLLTSDEASWIASLSNIGQLFGAVATGVLSGKLGRRPTLMILCAPLLAGWATVALAGRTVWLFYLGRVLQGVGVMSSVTQVYLVEVADTEHRGMFGASGALSVSVGITLVYCLGAVLHWRLVCLVCGLLPVIVFVAMFFLPETPPWLVVNGKKEEAEKVLRWLRGERYDISKEIEALSASAGGGPQSSSLAETLALFKYPAAYKPFIILLFVFIFQQLSGSYAVIFYAVNVFRDIGVSTNPYIPAIITGIIRITGTLIGTALVKKYGRRPLMTVSAILMGVFMTSLAVTVFYKDQFYSEHCLPLRPNATLPDHCHQVNSTLVLESDVADDGYRENLVLVFDIWPALSVILYILVFGAGVGTIPWLLLGELCPSKVKGVASGVTVSVAFVCIFAVVKLFPFGLQYLTPSGTYAFFAVVSLAMAVFTVFCVPETKGKTLQEIQTMFGELEVKQARIGTISADVEQK